MADERPGAVPRSSALLNDPPQLSWLATWSAADLRRCPSHDVLPRLLAPSVPLKIPHLDPTSILQSWA